METGRSLAGYAATSWRLRDHGDGTGRTRAFRSRHRLAAFGDVVGRARGPPRRRGAHGPQPCAVPATPALSVAVARRRPRSQTRPDRRSRAAGPEVARDISP